MLFNLTSLGATLSIATLKVLSPSKIQIYILVIPTYSTHYLNANKLPRKDRFPSLRRSGQKSAFYESYSR